MSIADNASAAAGGFTPSTGPTPADGDAQGKGMILLSYLQASEMLRQFQQGGQACTSLDLGRTQTHVSVKDDQAVLSEESRISLDELRKIADCEDVVFTVRNGRAEKLIRYSESTSRTYKLRPTSDWPALEISGILMHRIGGTTPRSDAEAKLRLLRPVRGAVLETCMGLGYTAILAAATADSVTVIEKDENVTELARLNPHSQTLFQEPKIRLILGDAVDFVRGFGDGIFDIVNHDPPTLGIAGELYADAFYTQLLRILKTGGRLLHYTGSPGSRGRGMDLNASVKRRLQKVGFVKIRGHDETGCILASRDRA